MTDNVPWGYTLVELVVVVAIIGLIATIALPLFASHTGAAQAAKLLKHHEEAVRVARQTFIQDRGSLALQTSSGLPASSADWIDHLSGGHGEAPGGGAPFVIGASGDVTSGAIGVFYEPALGRLVLARPAFRGLPAQHALVTAERVSYATP